MIAISPSSQISIRAMDGVAAPAVTTSIAEFAQDNDFGPDEVAALIADLQAGQPHMIGGGAAPLFQIERA